MRLIKGQEKSSRKRAVGEEQVHVRRARPLSVDHGCRSLSSPRSRVMGVLRTLQPKAIARNPFKPANLQALFGRHDIKRTGIRRARDPRILPLALGGRLSTIPPAQTIPYKGAS